MKKSILSFTDELPSDFQNCIEFHGHICPGLAYGYIVSREILKRFNIARALDEEIVIITECDSCSVDAFQVMLGTTSGKGNLIIKNNGKNIFTVYLRKNKKALKFTKRVYYTYRGNESEIYHDLDNKINSGRASNDEISMYKLIKAKDIIAQNIEDIFSIEYVDIPAPERAEIADSVKCSSCGSLVMITKSLRLADNTRICIECAEKMLENK